MSKKSKATQSAIEQMDAQQRKLEADRKKDELNDKKESMRPSLLKRLAAGLIDFAFSAIIAVGIFAISYYTIFPLLGYQSSAQYIIDSYESSKLFVYGSSGYEYLSSHYDDSKTPEQNYDVPVTRYYKTNARAVKEGEYEKYTTRLINSGYYEYNAQDEIVRKEGISNATAKEYLEKEYKTAVSYFFADPALKEASVVTGRVMSLSLLIVSTIASAVFFILIPLVDKRNRTFGYMFLKIMPVDSKTIQPISKKWNLLRNFIFITITFISPFTMNLLLGTLAYSFIPFFINSAILSFSRNNTGLHDLAAGANVINQSYSNAFEVLKSINKQGGQQ